MLLQPAVWTTRLTTPGASAFAVLFGLESFSRALVAVAMSVQTLEIVGSDEGVSLLFLIGALASLTTAFVIPRLALAIGRAPMCSLALVMIAASSLFFMTQLLPSQVAAFIIRAAGVAIFYAGLSMFIMDHISRRELGRSEPLRMLSVGIAWTIGPPIGVELWAWGGPWAPFAAAGVVALLALGYFWTLRLRGLPIMRSTGGRRLETRFANIAEYLAQPRLVLAWLHAIGRGIFWIAFVIYTPLYALETGLGVRAGGLIIALGTGFMLLMPLWGWVARRYGIRRVSLVAFPSGGVLLVLAGLLADRPELGAACLILSACAMAMIDGYGNALFFRACKPSQRIRLTAIFSTHRDLSNVLQGAIFALLLSVLPVSAIFPALGIVLFALGLLATRIHGRL